MVAIDDISPLIKEIFYGRPISIKREAADAAKLIKNWLEDCKKTHSRRSRVHSSVQIPTRLLDLGTEGSDPRLITTSEEPPVSTEYIYLSYNWGASALLTTKKENIQEFQKKISPDKFARLHRDVLDLCRRLGHRYVYLDALCFIHNDEKDKIRETSRMGDYISSAELVIATTQKNADEPLFGSYPERAEYLVTFTACLEDKSEETFDLLLRNPRSTTAQAVQENLIERAWRTQEAFLASRLVIIEETQISWCCNTIQVAEGSTAILPPTLDNFPSLESWVENHKGIVAPEKVLQVIFLRWYSIVQTISQGRLKRESTDRFPAMAGFASKFQQLMARWDCDYLAGIWAKDLAHGLLWIDDKSQHSYDNSDIPESDFCPSWSWASNGGPVSYCLTAGLKIPHVTDGDAEFALIKFDAGQNALMRPMGAFLEVSAMSIAGSITEITSHFQYFFDSNSQAELCMIEPAEILDKCQLAILATWTCQLGSKDHVAHWVGLVLQEVEEQTFKRKGVFIGPDVEMVLADCWKRTEMKLI
jgi:heterokaryon incompatibility protein (HET)